ncbi:MAG: sulfatase [Planctomycetaceae bacterium]|nr:sulfatase [Planctomycetaceae bacterium]
MLPISRRELLKRSGTGFGMLGLSALLAEESKAAVSSDPMAPKSPHFPARAKNVIFLFMNGGPSHVDTFDPKPELKKQEGKPGKGGKYMASPYKFKKYGESGIDVSEIYPHLSKQVDELCVLRGMHTTTPNHEPGLLMMNSGAQQPIRPCLGSWLNYGLGTENQNLPGFVVLCPGKPVVGPALWGNSFLPGIFQGTHINNSKIDPNRVIAHIRNNHLSGGSQRRVLDLLQALNRRHLEDRDKDQKLEARIQSLEIAYRMQFEAQQAFDVRQETESTQKLYGPGEFANGCLIARRLVERGVRMVQLYYGSGQPWDAHGNIMDHKRDAGKSDQAIAALISDLRQRGLLNDTLIIWGGEFGRTPTAQGSNGRNHHNTGFTVWLAGGGTKRGYIHGATDELGVNAIENRMDVHDLHATILHLMGLDHTQLTYRYSGRDFRLTDVHGNVAHEIIA